MSSTTPATDSGSNQLRRTIYLLVLFVSCAHALVHVLELSLSSVEQIIGESLDESRQRMGNLGTAFRLPFGLFALLTGVVADRMGPRRLLCFYLFGSAVVCGLMPFADDLSRIFVAMFLLGCFASIYHPAGLALLSHHTTPENRGRALGLHGIFGSVGIATAPFIAGLALSANISWQQYYLLLTGPLILVGLTIMVYGRKAEVRIQANADQQNTERPDSAALLRAGEPTTIDWRRYLTAVAATGVSGMVYAAFLHFLPRYLNDANLLTSLPQESSRNYLAAIALICGAVGQWIAGRLAKPGRLEWMLFIIMLGNAPFLFWMAYATGSNRLLACCLLALVHFMNQPVYNSLLATLIPPEKRSTGYGFSNMINFGIGSLGPSLAGLMKTDRATYTMLACIACTAALLALPLALQSRRQSKLSAQN